MYMTKKQPSAEEWPEKLTKLQERLHLTNDEMALRLDVPKRTWLSWKYGERTPSVAARRLIGLLIQGKI